MKTGRRLIGNARRRTEFGVFDDEHGATAIEYAILASLIAAVVAGTVQLLGVKTQALFQAVLNVWP